MTFLVITQIWFNLFKWNLDVEDYRDNNLMPVLLLKYGNTRDAPIQDFNEPGDIR